MSRTIRVLSIDGGGIRDIIPALVLARVEAATGKRIFEMFDLTAGTSGGGILVAGLTKPKPFTAAEMADFYIHDGPRIFCQSPVRNITSFISQPKYNAATLESVLLKSMGSYKLSECLTNVIIPAYDIKNRDAHFFKSWRANGILSPPNERPEDANYLLRDVCRATSAAPTYIEPAVISNMAGMKSYFIDGSIFANNPSLCAYASIPSLFPDATKTVVVSLGTGSLGQSIPIERAKEWGALSWARPLIESMMEGAGDIVDYQMRELFSRNVTYCRIQTRLADGVAAPGESIDDASPENIRRLIVRGNLLAEQSIKKITTVIEDSN